MPRNEQQTFMLQSHWQGGRLMCPYHVCHTCSSDNPQDKRSRAPNEKIARCVRCPSAYHASTSCLPAGSTILTASQIVCPKHYKARYPPLNATWCFLCTRGGSLICCDTCPTSFHLECLGKFYTFVQAVRKVPSDDDNDNDVQGWYERIIF